MPYVFRLALLFLVLILRPGLTSALEILAPVELKVALPDAAPAAAKDVGVPVTADYYADTIPSARAAVADAKSDLFIASDEGAFRAAQSAGLVTGPGAPIFYKRLAIAVRPKNPKMIFTIEDLAKDGVRLVVAPEGETTLGSLTHKIIAQSPSAAGITRNITQKTADPARMIALLKSGDADTLLCWDTIEPQALGELAIMRLPWRICPTQTCCGAVTRHASSPAAAKLLAFLASQATHDLLFARGFWMESGEHGGEHMDKTASGPFAPMYPLLAKQIVDDYGIKEGVCVDIGCGPGQLPIELIKITKLTLWGVDIEPQSLAIALRHAKEAGVAEDRLHLIAGDALCLPLPDNFADLVVSRGTVPFLRDKALGFREAYRILKPGGVAFMGGGFSRYQPKDEVEAMRKVARENREGGGNGGAMKMDFEPLLRAAGITRFRIIKDNGHWVEMRK